MNWDAIGKSTVRLLVLVVLIVLLLGILTWAGFIKCRAVPGWCEAYWGIITYTTGAPRVLIVYGDSGLGDPNLLEDLLENPELIGAYVDRIHLDRLSIGNLRSYHVVIVEKAKKIETDDLKILMQYVDQGGRLVWTGDAGTELGQDDNYLYLDERVPGGKHTIIGPWARKQGDIAVNFDHFLSVEYITNFCSVEGNQCPEGGPFSLGVINPEITREHPIIRGMASSLPLYAFSGQDMAIVKTIEGGITTEVMSIDFGSKLRWKDTRNESNETVDLGRSAPMIVTSGLGERVAYYALPPEYFANPKLYTFESYFMQRIGKVPYYTIPLEGVYYGMLYGA